MINEILVVYIATKNRKLYALRPSTHMIPDPAELTKMPGTLCMMYIILLSKRHCVNFPPNEHASMVYFFIILARVMHHLALKTFISTILVFFTLMKTVKMFINF